MSNPYEEAGRLRKVAALVRTLQVAHITADLAAIMDYQDWVAAAEQANCKPPSDETKAAVLDELRKAEALKADREFRKAFTPNRHGEYA